MLHFRRVLEAAVDDRAEAFGLQDKVAELEEASDAHVVALLGVLVVGSRLVDDVVVVVVHEVVVGGVGHLGLISVCYGGDDGRSGGGSSRESATSLTSGSQKPIGSHLLHQPPCWFGALRRFLAAVSRLLFQRSKEKKAGSPCQGRVRATVC